MSDAAPPSDGPEQRSGEPKPDPLAKLRTGKSSAFGAAGKYAGLGLQFALSILVFLFAGQWLDRRIGTEPLFLMLGVFLGAGAAFYSMYRTLVADQRKDEEREARLKNERVEKEEKDKQGRE